MIKSAVNQLMPVHPNPFNTVLKSGIMPQTWCNGIITQFLKVVLIAIPQTTVEYVFPVVLENYSVQFSTKDFFITLQSRLIFYINLKVVS